MLEKITEENFPQLVEAHQKMDEAKAIRDALGIGRQNA